MKLSFLIIIVIQKSGDERTQMKIPPFKKGSESIVEEWTKRVKINRESTEMKWV